MKAKKLDLFTVEELIFQNQKAKSILGKEFEVFFKEYIFLKQSGVDQGLISNLFMRFFDKFQEKSEEYIFRIFESDRVYYSYRRDKNNINITILLNDQSYNINNNTIKYSISNETILNNLKRFQNLTLYRDETNLYLSFWK